MGQLPLSRTQLEFPFLKCSVDYAGPVMVSDRKGRGCNLIKTYLCIFVCLAVKAIHIELVTDLSKEAYIAALNRFVARRGKPQSILYDNGTNFVVTSNELKRFLHDANIAFEIEQQGIKFDFTPPYSPHFNSIAEVAVRSTKYHLKRMLGMSNFTYEEMYTCLCQIEAVLNSRPITPLFSDLSDLTTLTPSHFLIGRSLMSIPHPQVPDIQINRLERYRRIELVKQHFWHSFAAEYRFSSKKLSRPRQQDNY
jgi:transposase InsO family protein